MNHTGRKTSVLFYIVEDQGGYFTAAQARSVGFSWERLSNNVKSEQFDRVSTGASTVL